MDSVAQRRDREFRVPIGVVGDDDRVDADLQHFVEGGAEGGMDSPRRQFLFYPVLQRFAGVADDRRFRLGVAEQSAEGEIEAACRSENSDSDLFHGRVFLTLDFFDSGCYNYTAA